MYGVIYMIVNLLNGMRYVGQTRQPLKKRMYQHAKANSYIGNAIRHYGWKNFTVEVIEECETLEQLNERERFWIDYFDCKTPNGYNCTAGGDGLSSPSAETIAKMKASSKRRFAEHPVTDETKAKQSATQTKRYEDSTEREKDAASQRKRFEDPAEHEKLSVAQKKRHAENPVTDETRAKRSVSMKKYCAEHPQSEEKRAQHSALMKKRFEDPAAREQASVAVKKYRAEHPYTDEEKAQRSVAMKKYCAEHPVSDETRAKRSVSIKFHFAKKRAVRGLLATLLVARRQADTSPEMSVTLIRATVEIFSRFADSQRVQ